jgi:hypothetical protein
MWDTGLIIATAAFFVVAIGYTMGCELLKGSQEKH